MRLRGKNVTEQLFAVLADGQRRQLVRVLTACNREDRVLTLADVSEAVAELSPIRLYHVHLPKLADASIIEWNQERDEITAGPRFDDAHQLLEQVCGQQDVLSAGI